MRDDEFRALIPTRGERAAPGWRRLTPAERQVRGAARRAFNAARKAAKQ